MKKTFGHASVFVARKATYVPRGSGAKMADLVGVPSLQIQRMGGWNTDTLSNSYLDSLTHDFIRIMAGFETVAAYYLPRANEDPRSELKQSVFPWVDYWQERYSNNDVLQTSGSANTFLKLIQCFKTTFLQDAAVMMDIIPNHPIWRHHLKVKSHIEENADLHSSTILQFAPELQQELSNINRALNNATKELHERKKRSDDMQQQLLEAINNFSNKKFNITVSMDNGSQAIATASTSALTTLSTGFIDDDEQISQPVESSYIYESEVESSHVATTSTVVRQYTSDGVPLYRMSREVTTVSDLWDEWKEGRDGDWAVEKIEREWGAKWRKNDRSGLTSKDA